MTKQIIILPVFNLEETKMKKVIAILLAAVSVLCLFAGCGDNKAAGGNENEDALKVAVLEGTCSGDVWQKVCDAFEEQTGIKIQLTVCKNESELASVKADVVHSGTDSELAKQFIKDKKLHDLSGVLAATIPGEQVKVADKMEAGFLESAVTMPYGDGKTYLAPIFFSHWPLFYNARRFESMRWDVPTTWDEMWLLADKALANDTYLFAYYEAEDMASLISALMYSTGGADFYTAVMNGDEAVWDSKEARNFAKTLEKLAKYTHPEFAGTGESDHLVIHKEALFMPNHTGVTTEMLMATQSISDGSFNWGVMALPAMTYGESRYIYNTVEQIWIPADAEKKADAEQFIAFLYSDKAAEMFSEKSAVQPIKGINTIVDSSAKWIYSVFDNGEKAAVGNGTVDTVLVDAFNQMVDGTIKTSEFLANMKAAAAQ